MVEGDHIFTQEMAIFIGVIVSGALGLWWRVSSETTRIDREWRKEVRDMRELLFKEYVHVTSMEKFEDKLEKVLALVQTLRDELAARRGHGPRT